MKIKVQVLDDDQTLELPETFECRIRQNNDPVEFDGTWESLTDAEYLATQPARIPDDRKDHGPSVWVIGKLKLDGEEIDAIDLTPRAGEIIIACEPRLSVADIDLVRLIQEAYDLSQVRGMGILHARPGPLEEAMAQGILDDFVEFSEGRPDHNKRVFDLDYVLGRAVKLRCNNVNGIPHVGAAWLDHSQSQLTELLERCRK